MKDLILGQEYYAEVRAIAEQQIKEVKKEIEEAKQLSKEIDEKFFNIEEKEYKIKLKKVDILQLLKQSKSDFQKLQILKTYSKECNLKMFNCISLENLQEVFETAINHLKPYQNGLNIDYWFQGK